MAARYYSGYFGGDKVAVAETASTTAAADVEVRVVYTADNAGKQALLVALGNIVSRITEDTWPPA